MIRTFFVVGCCIAANFFTVALHAQQSFVVETTLDWAKNTAPAPIATPLHFAKATIGYNGSVLPVFQRAIPVPQTGTATATVVDMQYEPVAHPSLDRYGSTELTDAAQVSVNVQQARNEKRIVLVVIPFRRTRSGSYERVKSFNIRISYTEKNTAIASRFPPAVRSQLADGAIYKIGIPETGIYKLDYNFLKTTLGISNLDDIDPRKIQVLGNKGGVLPEANSALRNDDLTENAVFISGEADGKFDTNDYLLLYAKGPHAFALSNGNFIRNTNAYSDKYYYFIKIADNTGKRIATRASLTAATDTAKGYDAVQQYEKDDRNLQRFFDDGNGGLGSGRQWFDKDYFRYTTERTYNFNFNNLIPTEPVRLLTVMASRSIGVGSSFTLQANGNLLATIPFGAVSGELQLYDYATTNLNQNKAQAPRTIYSFYTNGNNINLKYTYNKGNNLATAWLDYITLNARCGLGFGGGQMAFRDTRTATKSATYFDINNNNATIWDVTDPNNVLLQGALPNNSGAFIATTNDALREFVAHDGSSYATPEAAGKIANQNLHGLATPDMVIVYNTRVSAQAAQQLAAHRRQFSGLKVAAVDINDIYNEFGSGVPDITALRDFARMLYKRNTGADGFRYLLLYGDASFDYRNRYGNDGNLVPTYESYSSMNDVNSFATDDYFGLLDDPEGGAIGSNNDDLDIAIGRIPVGSPESAQDVLNKIIRYDTDPAMMSDWVNRIAFGGDDQDGNTHTLQADAIAADVSRTYNRFNINKIYLDYYEQINGAGGARYPAVNEAINAEMYKGTLVWSYTGHGGPDGLAQERVENAIDVNTWNNLNAMPLCITASCSVGVYDEPNGESLGEMILRKPNSGGIALFTTIRPVGSAQNQALNTNIFDTLFTNKNNLVANPITLGEVLQYGKNKANTGENGLKFLLMGDPAQRLARPEYKVVTSTINNINVATDTAQIGALQEVRIAGEIRDENNIFSPTYNGTLYITIFDKEQRLATRVNDPDSAPFSFQMRKSVIFKGRATITNGKWQLAFVVPQNIDYNVGVGKISYYAAPNTGLNDAGGSDFHLKIGGTNRSSVTDKEPPVVKAFMNDEKFVSGGTTTDKPVLLLKLSDNLGINTAGSGIGKDITAIIDGKTNETRVLNDFYESDRDNPRAGKVRFPLDKIAVGKHTMVIKAWDVENNSGEDRIEFVVKNDGNIVLDHVLNYPNPFSTNTSFEFEHNMAGQNLDVQIGIFTITGQEVKSIQKTISAEGFRVSRADHLDFDATDNFGSRLANGVYLYRVSVTYIDAAGARAVKTTPFEKLVILK